MTSKTKQKLDSNKTALRIPKINKSEIKIPDKITQNEVTVYKDGFCIIRLHRKNSNSDTFFVTLYLRITEITDHIKPQSTGEDLPDNIRDLYLDTITKIENKFDFTRSSNIICKQRYNSMGRDGIIMMKSKLV